MNDMTRRGFLGAAAATAACPTVWGGEPRRLGFTWCYMLKLGTNMWCDCVPPRWGNLKPDEMHYKAPSEELRCDDSLWRELTEKARAAGFNMLLMDLGEGVQFPSHPELAVKGSWSPEKLQKELARLRAIGLEPVPKLNFSTAHDIWLKDYSRMVSTSKYYQVCADLIRDVAELFGHPRLFHIGYDEETFGHQDRYQYVVVRQGDLWWHDLLWMVEQIEKAGMRSWIWSDYIWKHTDEFLKRMPKSVLQSNWYYGKTFDSEKRNTVKAYLDLERGGFDQMPTGSNYSCVENFAGTVDFCRKNISPDRLKGFIMAPWRHTIEHWRGDLVSAIDIARPVIANPSDKQGIDE